MITFVIKFWRFCKQEYIFGHPVAFRCSHLELFVPLHCPNTFQLMNHMGRSPIACFCMVYKTPLSCFPVILYCAKMRKVESINFRFGGRSTSFCSSENTFTDLRKSVKKQALFDNLLSFAGLKVHPLFQFTL